MSDTPSQGLLFEVEPPWKKEWKDMPEFVQEDMMPFDSVLVNFASPGDKAAFFVLLGRATTADSGAITRSVWYPEADIGHMANKRYADES